MYRYYKKLFWNDAMNVFLIQFLNTKNCHFDYLNFFRSFESWLILNLKNH